MQTEKRCATCGERKPVTDFHVNENGWRGTCKACRRNKGASKRPQASQPITPKPQPLEDEATAPGTVASDERFSGESWASIPDVHDPNHDPWAWAIALRVVQMHRPRLLHIAGDLMDCESLSVHAPTSRRDVGSFDSELASANRRLDEIAQAIPSDCKVVFTEGNHEFRWVRELAKFQHQSALLGASLSELLKFEQRGWKWIPFREHYTVPGTNLRLTHSLEKFGLNSVRDHSKDIGDGSIIIGDIHRRELYESGDADGNYRFAACFGWLGDVSRITYMHRTKCRRTWRHGLGVGWFVDGRAHPHTVPIIDRRAVFNGQLVKAT